MEADYKTVGQLVQCIANVFVSSVLTFVLDITDCSTNLAEERLESVSLFCSGPRSALTLRHAVHIHVYVHREYDTD